MSHLPPQVYLQLQLQKQPNTVLLVLVVSWEPGPSPEEWPLGLASACPPFSQVVEPEAWELVPNHPSPMEGPWEPWGSKVERESEFPRLPTHDLINVGATAWWRM